MFFCCWETNIILGLVNWAIKGPRRGLPQQGRGERFHGKVFNQGIKNSSMN